MTTHNLLRLRFDGRHYHGWQLQKNAVTVCGTLQDALELAVGERPSVRGCGRTDSGVHALEYVCDFFTESQISPARLAAALNCWLPKDISVLSASRAPEGFHSRFSAVTKEYMYLIRTDSVRDPFYDGLALEYRRPLSTELLNEVASVYLGTHDFSAFCASGSPVEDKVRTIYSSHFTNEDGIVVYRVTGNGFLYNMVRIMVGTALACHEGKMTVEGVTAALESKNRSAAGRTVTGAGLYLVGVNYGEALR